METEKVVKRNILLVLALIFMHIGMLIQTFWISVWYIDSLGTPEEKSEFFLSKFPAFMQNHITIAFVAFLASTAAFVLGALSLNRIHNKMRWLAFTIIAVSFLFGSLSLFQMM